MTGWLLLFVLMQPISDARMLRTLQQEGPFRSEKACREAATAVIAMLGSNPAWACVPQGDRP